MQDKGFNRQWARHFDEQWSQHRGGWDGRGATARGDGPGRQGPPPWVAGLFGLAQGDQPQRGPRVRRGDVRAAILDVLAAEPMNGYQVISPDRRAHRRGVEAEPRLGLPDHLRSSRTRA